MATTNDLHKSISDMSEEELFTRLRDLRQSRRTKKVTRKTSNKPIKELDLDAAIGKMSPEAKMRLAEVLEKE